MLCSRKEYRALLAKCVPSGCLLCLGLYHSYGRIVVLSEVSLVGAHAECLRICSNISSITHPVLKNEDFSKEMSAGAVERSCRKQAVSCCLERQASFVCILDVCLCFGGT